MTRIKSRQEKLRAALQERGAKIPTDIARLGNALWGDGEDETAHRQCLGALPTYVSAEADGIRVAKLYPQVKRHLDACDSCSEQHADMLQLALADLGGALLRADNVPAPDLSFLDHPVALKDLVLTWTKKILTSLSPQQLPDLQEIGEAFFEQVQGLGGKFPLQSLPGGAVRGQGSKPASALTVLALTYTAAENLASTLTTEKIDESLRTGTLKQLVETSTLSAAEGSDLEPGMVSGVAKNLAAQIVKDPQSLRALVKQGRV